MLPQVGLGEVDTARVIVDLMRESVGWGHTILMVTHDPEIAALTDRWIRLRDGRLDAESDADTKPLKAEPE